jgi:hypothetical protein
VLSYEGSDRNGPRVVRGWKELASGGQGTVVVIHLSMSATTQRDPPDDSKHRCANRSTKVSGKLKVLPEQPEPGPVPTKRALLAPAQSSEGSGATGESDDDDGDGGPDEDETEDVDVR